MATTRNNPVLIDVKIRGVPRVMARLNKIIANLPIEMNLVSRQLIQYAQIEARRVIKEKIPDSTFGDFIVTSEQLRKQGRLKDGATHSLHPDAKIASYAGFVHDGFKGHWVHKDMLGDWLKRHPEVALRNGKWLEVGFPKKDGTGTSASWLVEGGVKFFDKAYAKMLGISEEEYKRRINKVLRG